MYYFESSSPEHQEPKVRGSWGEVLIPLPCGHEEEVSYNWDLSCVAIDHKCSRCGKDVKVKITQGVKCEIIK